MSTVQGIDVEAETARLVVLSAITLDRIRRRAGITRLELARRLGIPPSRVTKVLEGTANITLKTLARFSLACGEHIELGVVKKQRAT